MHETLRKLWYVAPRRGAGGVGDYSSDIFSAVASAFQRAEYLESGGVGGDTVAQIQFLKRTLKRAAKASIAGDVIHFELSGGSLGPFWGIPKMSTKAVMSATIHDAPNPVWWPLRSKAVNSSRLWTHALHYPVRTAWAGYEAKRIADLHLIALTRSGERALSGQALSSTYIPHYVPQRPSILPLVERPLGVGLFGHNYGGKGFESLPDLRRHLPLDVEIHVAGRGTELLERISGVKYHGPVDGVHEERFFESVRTILVPYTEESRYGTILSASGVTARAFAFGTPVVASAVRAFPGEADGLSLVTASGSQAIAERANAIVRDAELLGQIQEQLEGLRLDRSLEVTGDRHLALWRRRAADSALR